MDHCTLNANIEYGSGQVTRRYTCLVDINKTAVEWMAVCRPAGWRSHRFARS